MNLDRFVRERRSSWDELDSLLVSCRGRPGRLPAPEAMRLGRLYRQACADLATARRAFPAESIVQRIEHLVARGRVAVYGAGTPRGSVRQFLSRGYWEAVAERPGILLASALLLLGPILVAGLWAAADSARAAGLAPDIFRGLAEQTGLGSMSESGNAARASISSAIFTNNARVSALAFAGGILAGVPTAGVLLMNGGFIGLIGGLAFSAGNGPVFLSLVAPHGVLELSCIVVAGAAGLRVGWALIEPGDSRRGAAAAAQGARAVRMLVGTVPFLAIAGVVEGFVTPQRLDLPLALALGTALGVVYWVLVVWRSRPAAPAGRAQPTEDEGGGPDPQTRAANFARR